MATLDNGAILREVYAAWNKKDLNRVASYATSDARMKNVPLGATTGFREYTEGWARAFPDGQIQVTTLVAQGDNVVAECIGRGTHTGALTGPAGDIPATGRHVELQFVEFYRFSNGKITEGRMYFDAATMMAQLGLAASATTTQRQTTSAPEKRH